MAKQTTDDAEAVRQKLRELQPFEDLAARLHELILEAAPDLQPRLWYGMPGYARAKGKPVLVFFRVDDAERVSFGITEHANLAPEPGATDKLLPSAWFLSELDGPTEAHITEIVRRATA